MKFLLIIFSLSSIIHADPLHDALQNIGFLFEAESEYFTEKKEIFADASISDEDKLEFAEGGLERTVAYDSAGKPDFSRTIETIKSHMKSYIVPSLLTEQAMQALTRGEEERRLALGKLYAYLHQSSLLNTVDNKGYEEEGKIFEIGKYFHKAKRYLKPFVSQDVIERIERIYSIEIKTEKRRDLRTQKKFKSIVSMKALFRYQALFETFNENLDEVKRVVKRLGLPLDDPRFHRLRNLAKRVQKFNEEYVDRLKRKDTFKLINLDLIEYDYLFFQTCLDYQEEAQNVLKELRPARSSSAAQGQPRTKRSQASKTPKNKRPFLLAEGEDPLEDLTPDSCYSAPMEVSAVPSEELSGASCSLAPMEVWAVPSEDLSGASCSSAPVEVLAVSSEELSEASCSLAPMVGGAGAFSSALSVQPEVMEWMELLRRGTLSFREALSEMGEMVGKKLKPKNNGKYSVKIPSQINPHVIVPVFFDGPHGAQDGNKKIWTAWRKSLISALEKAGWIRS